MSSFGNRDLSDSGLGDLKGLRFRFPAPLPKHLHCKMDIESHSFAPSRLISLSATLRAAVNRSLSYVSKVAPTGPLSLPLPKILASHYTAFVTAACYSHQWLSNRANKETHEQLSLSGLDLQQPVLLSKVLSGAIPYPSIPTLLARLVLEAYAAEHDAKLHKIRVVNGHSLSLNFGLTSDHRGYQWRSPRYSLNSFILFETPGLEWIVFDPTRPRLMLWQDQTICLPSLYQVAHPSLSWQMSIPNAPTIDVRKASKSASCIEHSSILTALESRGQLFLPPCGGLKTPPLLFQAEPIKTEADTSELCFYGLGPSDIVPQHFEVLTPRRHT